PMPPAPQIACEFFPGGIRAYATEPDVDLTYYEVVLDAGGEGWYEPIFGPCGGRSGNLVSGDLEFPSFIECDPECNLSGLAPGVHNLYFGYSSNEGEGEYSTLSEGDLYFDYFFTIPETPAISNVGSTDD